MTENQNKPKKSEKKILSSAGIKLLACELFCLVVPGSSYRDNEESIPLFLACIVCLIGLFTVVLLGVGILAWLGAI